MKLSKSLIILAKFLLADVNYFKLAQNILEDIFNKFKYLHYKNPNSHVNIFLDEDQFANYLTKYHYPFDKNQIRDLTVFFFNCKNQQKDICGDKINNFNDLFIQLKKVTSSEIISGLTSPNGNIIIINYNNNQLNGQLTKIKNKLQHQLIHVFKKISNLQKNYKSYSIIDYFLSEIQFPNFVTDCCNYYINHKSDFKNDLKLIDNLYKFNDNDIINIIKKLHLNNGELLMFIILHKKYNVKKYNKILILISDYINKK